MALLPKLYPLSSALRQEVAACSGTGVRRGPCPGASKLPCYLRDSSCQPQRAAVVVSLALYESERYVDAIVQNALAFTQSATRIGIHLSANSNYSADAVLGSAMGKWPGRELVINPEVVLRSEADFVELGRLWDSPSAASQAASC